MTAAIEVRERVRGSLLLCEESTLLDDAKSAKSHPPVEYRSLDAPT